MKTPIRFSILTFATSIALMSLVGCRQEEEVSASAVSDPQTDAVESAITMLSGQADDASGGSFALKDSSSTWKYAMVESLVGGVANAANCGRAYDQVCNNADGTKSITYSDCSLGARPFTLNGYVTLTYSNNSCALNVGDNVVRTYDHTISGPRGGSIQTTSALRSDYLGNQIGGGGRLTHTAPSSWQIDILGKHKIGTYRARPLFDVSIRTTTPVVVDGSLSRSSRSVSSGALEVNHNLAKFTATFSVEPTKPLVWNATCCHPVSGQLNAVYSGSVTGSGSITFNGCGSADLAKDGSTRTLSIGYCE